MNWRLITEEEHKALEKAHPRRLQRFISHQLTNICSGPRLRYWRCEPPGCFAD